MLGSEPRGQLGLRAAGFLLGIAPDRSLVREAQADLAIRWSAGFGLHDALPDQSSLTRIRQRRGAERFRRIFVRTVQACVEARIARGEVVHILQGRPDPAASPPRGFVTASGAG